jgi:hypothetical protein
MVLKKSAASMAAPARALLRRVTQAAAGVTAVLTAVVGLNLAFEGPAAAAAGRWVPYGNNNPITGSPSTWVCGGTIPVASDVLAQACTIRTPSLAYVQSAVIVRNNRSSLYSLYATSRMYSSVYNYEIGSWTCDSSGVGAHSWSVCFGETKDYSLGAYSVGIINAGTFLPTTPHF